MPGNTMGDVGALALMPQVAVNATRPVSKVQSTDGGDFGSIIEDARLSNIASSNKSLQTDKTLQNTRPNDSQKDVKKDERIRDDDKDTKAYKKETQNKKDTKDTKEIKKESPENQNKISDPKLDKQNDLKEEIVKDLKEAGDELVTLIAGELDQTDESILEVLAQLGMTQTDLFNPENLTQVVMEAAGADVTEILMDEDLSSALHELMIDARRMIEEVADNNDIEPQDVGHMLDILGEMEEGRQIPLQDKDLQNIQKPDNSKTLEDKIEIDFDDKEIGSLPKYEQVYEKDDAKNKGGDSKEFKSDEHSLFSQTEEFKTGDINPYQQISEGIKEAFDEVSDKAETAQQTTTNSQDVINQITDYMKVNIKAETSSMEIQLHPASLGTVKVMVEQAVDGGVTARFTASTEEAKAAIQVQITQLWQKLDEQGLKVNAVEVLVDAHAFEQNLEKGNQQNAAEQEEKRRSRIRRINLGDPDLLQEDALENDEETKLAAEMMAANGQTIDFTA